LQTYHIHIQGIVQGVGFRPFVYQRAIHHGMKGWVNNTNDGVHIQITDHREQVELFLKDILDHLPPLAIVTHHTFEQTDFQDYTSFEIVESTATTQPKLLVTPDVALCEDCRNELHNPDNRRFQYPFITCTNCGPRYSIIQKLPYDRPYTTMQPFEMCPVCLKEYHNPMERRHFSQTNSCPDCAIEMQWYATGISNPDSNRSSRSTSQNLIENFTDLNLIMEAWHEGKIIAIKGIGGYLLTCDATNVDAVETLRHRKHRPSKPFALMYPSLDILRLDAKVSPREAQELKSIAAPIVLLQTHTQPKSKLALAAINKGLSKIGVMLPYTPLLELLLQDFGKPIVATSANISNSTIIYEDEKAMRDLASFADMLLMNNREITIPQDDGVVQFTDLHQIKITLRRSRGKAPVYINPNLKLPHTKIFAPGAMLKSVFGFVYENNFYISQYLGNTESYDAQQNYIQTYQHLQQIFNISFDQVVTDLHPDYFATRFGQELAAKDQASLKTLQHHQAHFWSVIGEHHLMKSPEPILGVIWDGTGLGDDGHIWGGEFFDYFQGKIERVHHLEEFPFILGDKMPREPRISAFVLGYAIPEAESILKPKFTDTEWQIYQKLITQSTLRCTSMGRLFDAVSSILFGYDIHTFEAEASMQLENRALHYFHNHPEAVNHTVYDFDASQPFVTTLLQQIVQDFNSSVDLDYIAFKFHLTLVDYIQTIAQRLDRKHLAFSGGVFQNALLVDLLVEKLQPNFTLYFQQEFSPNDEGIAFGQLISMTEFS